MFYATKKGMIMKKLFAILSVLAVSLSMTACNTMKGMGKDVERGGEKVQSAVTGEQSGGSSQSGAAQSGTSDQATTQQQQEQQRQQEQERQKEQQRQ
jgi:predicted small secreted protein